MTDAAAEGWEMLANEEEGAAVLAGILSLDADKRYARSELATAADIPLKTLYLVEMVDQLETAGVLERVDDVDEPSEAEFVLNADSDVYQAAATFGELFATRLTES